MDTTGTHSRWYGGSRGGNPANRRTRRTALRLASMSEAIARPPSDPAFREAVWRAVAVDADMKKLGKSDLELIYGNWCREFEDAVAGEWEADPDSIVDRGPSARDTCKLCAHNPIRFEFRLRNRMNGNEVWTGSVCIVEYGVNVRGAGTEAEARKLLLGAVDAARVVWECREWQDANPGADEQIEDACAFFGSAVAAAPFGVAGPLVARLRRGDLVYQALARQIAKRGYLTERRTREWAEWRGAIAGIRGDVEAALADARERSSAPGGGFYDRLLASRHCAGWEVRVVRDLAARGVAPEAMVGREAALVRRIVKRVPAGAPTESVDETLRQREARRVLRMLAGLNGKLTAADRAWIGGVAGKRLTSRLVDHVLGCDGDPKFRDVAGKPSLVARYEEHVLFRYE